MASDGPAPSLAQPAGSTGRPSHGTQVRAPDGVRRPGAVARRPRPVVRRRGV